MENYVNVNFFWGGRIIRRGDDVRYSKDPGGQRYVMLGTKYEEFRAIVYEVMGIDRNHWDVKMSYKYPQVGIGNVASHFLVGQITSDMDVDRLLSIPRTMLMGLGDVSVFLEADKVQEYDPYNYGQNMHSEPTHSSYQQDFGTSNQVPEFGTGGWSNYYFGGGASNDEYQGHGGGSSSQAIQYSQQQDDYQMQNYYTPTDYVEPSPRVEPLAGRELALVHENSEDEGGSSRSEDWDYLSSDDEEDLSEDETEEEVPRTVVIQTAMIEGGRHTPRAPWFETEEYTPIVLHNQDANYTVVDPESENIYVGQMFSDKNMLVNAVRNMHIKSNRMYIVVRSNPEQFIAKCTVQNCPWRVRAAKKKSHGFFQITKCTEHICLCDHPTQDHKKITARLVADIVKPHVVGSPNLPIKNVLTFVTQELNHNVKYMKAWRGKQLAVEDIYGKWSTTYDILPQFFMAIAHSNPGSAVVIEAEADENIAYQSICKRVFFYLKAVMDGWQHARPVLSIDGTFLKGKYNGKLLIAMGVDSNNHQYPVCYALVEEESADNWGWFLKLLRKHVCKDRMRVCIISDRAAGILAAISDPDNGFTPPAGIHRWCLHHFRSNFSSKHPGGDLKRLMWLAGSTSQVKKYKAYMKRIGEVSPGALQWLCDVSPELWTICNDRGGARYGQTTTNIMEGYNGNIRMARFLPVTAMMEYIFYRNVRIVNTQRNRAVDALHEGQQFCQRSNEMITRYLEKAKAHSVTTHSRQHGIFTVVTQRYRVKGCTKGGHQHNVDISKKSCTCGKWKCHHMPCSHVMAGCLVDNIDWKQWVGPYHYSSKLHKLWEPLIFPLPSTDLWNYVLPADWQKFGKLLPNPAYKKVKKKRGTRGESVRIRTEMDQSRSGIKCSRCKQEGHTKRSRLCPQRPPDPSS